MSQRLKSLLGFWQVFVLLSGNHLAATMPVPPSIRVAQSKNWEMFGFFFFLLRVEGGGMKALNRRLTVFVVVVEWLNMARLNPPIESWLLLMLRITRELLPRYSMDHQACRHVNNGCVLTPTSKRAIVPRSTSQVCLCLWCQHYTSFPSVCGFNCQVSWLQRHVKTALGCSYLCPCKIWSMYLLVIICCSIVISIFFPPLALSDSIIYEVCTCCLCLSAAAERSQKHFHNVLSLSSRLLKHLLWRLLSGIPGVVPSGNYCVVTQEAGVSVITEGDHEIVITV